MALLGQLTTIQTTKLHQKSVEITNPKELPQMKLSDWKRFDSKERFDLYKQSELKVNNLNADIAKINTENQTLIGKLHEANGALEMVTNNIKKQQIRLGLIKQEQDEADKREQVRQKMLENGKKLIEQAKLKERQLLREKQLID